MSESDDFEQKELEAAIWGIKLSEDPDDEELQKEFETWLDESDLNKKLFDQTKETLGLIDKARPATRDQWEGTWQHTPPKLRAVKVPIPQPSTSVPSVSVQKSAASRFNLWQLFINGVISWRKTVATAAFAFCLLLIFAPALQLRLQADYLTTTAEQQTITLDDGSLVTLAPESALSVEFREDERHVHLIQGNAFFAVNPDASRPFIVEAGETVTTVVGTQFNVRLTDLGAMVAVEEGRVRVNDLSLSPALAEELEPGDRLRITWQEGFERDQIALDEVALWREGGLIARSMPMSEVIEILQTYHKGLIVIRSSTFSDIRVSGFYDLNDPVRTLNSLANAYGADVTQVSPWLLLVTDEE